MTLKELLALMSDLTRKIGILAGIFILYGYLCRWFNIYFFWESKALGWLIFLVFLIFYFVDLRRGRKGMRKNTTLVKILMGITIFILFAQILVEFIMLNTSVLEVGKKYLVENKGLQADMGRIISVTPMPYGSVQISSSDKGSSGSADIWVLVKGENKFLDVELILQKDYSSPWQVVAKNF
jgi:hypothetical protein